MDLYLNVTTRTDNIVQLLWRRETLNLAVLSLKENDDLARLTNKWWYDRGECAKDKKVISRCKVDSFQGWQRRC